MLHVVSAIAILMLVPTLSLLYRPFLDVSDGRARTVLTLAVATSAAGVWIIVSSLVPSVSSSALWLPTTALAALAGFLSSIPLRDGPSRPLPVLVYSSAWSLCVFVPVALVVIFPHHLDLVAAFGILDLGGALPVHVAAGASVLALLLVKGRYPRSSRPHVLPGKRRLVASGIILWVGWAVGLAGLELAFDDLTPLIVANSVLAPLAGVFGWTLIERIRTNTSTPSGLMGGLLCGLVAITPGGGLLSPGAALITGAVAGACCASLTFARVAATGQRAWFLVSAHLVAASVGLVSLALLGTGFGFVYTGQMGQVQVQLFSVVGVAAWAGGVSLLLWSLTRRLVPSTSEAVPA